MEWRIRQAEAADSGRLALIGAASFLETFAGILQGDAIVAHCARHHDAESYGRLLAGPHAGAWLAEARQGGAPIGYALVCAPDLPGADPDGGDLELKRIYTLSRTHGSGIGPALMAHAVEHAKAEGAKRLLLGVYRHNLRALAFYGRHGFTRIAERQFRVGDQLCEDVVLARLVD